MTSRRDQAATDQGTGSRTTGDVAVTLPVIRQDRMWITRPGEDTIIVCGRSLRELQTTARDALALLHGTDQPPAVQLKPESAELDLLAEQRRTYDEALRAAVRQLLASGASWTDVAQACQVRITDAQAAAHHTTPENDCAR
ncbi:hypothetical protein GCM10029978_066420 [Actinoallomurus acanthiterrae]